jgi:UDP-glucose 4-epimerase
MDFSDAGRIRDGFRLAAAVMTVAIIGAGSFIGTALAAQCRARHIDVVGIDALPPEGSGWLRADIRASDVADAIPDGAAAIVHLAALSRDPDCREKAQACFDVNVMGTLNLIRAAKVRNVKQFVFASSEWVYDSFMPGVEKSEDAPIDAARLASEYALSKYVSENNLRQQAVHGFCPATVLRFGIVYGPRRTNWSAVEALLNAVATTDEVRVGSRATARRFIHVADVADGILAALGQTNPYDIFNIQGPSLVTLGDVIECSAEILGRAPRIVETDPGAPSVRAVSSRKAAAALGWSARIGIRDGLADIARHLGLSDAAA